MCLVAHRTNSLLVVRWCLDAVANHNVDRTERDTDYCFDGQVSKSH